MKTISKYSFLCLIVLTCILPPALAAADEPMTVVANSQNQTKAQKWVDFLLMNEVDVEFVEPGDFNSIKTAKYVAIMGGVDDPAVKKLVSDILGPNEATAMAKPGAKKMYIKKGYGAQDQEMLIFTGSDTQAAVDARTESRDTWMPMLTEWFDLDDGPGGLKAY